MKQLSNQQLTC